MSELEFTESLAILRLTKIFGNLEYYANDWTFAYRAYHTINQRKQTDFEAFRQFRRKHFAPNIFLRRWFAAMGHPRPRLFSLVLLTTH